MVDCMSYRSDLGKARGLGSAKEGASHWWLQRVTAIILIPLSLWFVFSVYVLLGSSYFEARAWVTWPENAFLMTYFICTALYHGYLGAKVVVEDYIHVKSFKYFKLIGMQIACVFAAGLAVFSILSVYFKG